MKRGRWRGHWKGAQELKMGSCLVRGVVMLGSSTARHVGEAARFTVKKREEKVCLSGAPIAMRMGSSDALFAVCSRGVLVFFFGFYFCVIGLSLRCH